MRFNDDAYLQTFYETGRYPKIHDDIMNLADTVNVNNVIDLGCCTGLLAHRLSLRYDTVIGIEPNRKYIDKAIRRDNITYITLKIADSTLPRLREIICEFNIDGIYARRVMPEIWETGGMHLVDGFIDTIYEAGVHYVVLEGRKPTRNAVNPLCSIEEEVNAFSGRYGVIAAHANCRALKRERMR